MAETTGAKKRLVVIDGKSVFYRGYYAMPNLSTKDGMATGGVYGFAVMALEVCKRLKPDYVCVAWDKPKTNIRARLKVYSEYKAGRKPAPPDFYDQVVILRELLETFGWPLYELDDYEADDIMGTLALQARANGLETLLVTSDLDMLQIVNGSVKVYALKTGLSNIDLYSPQSFEAKYHIRVDQFLDMKSLKGDSSDNIPGVPGIGEKTAIELLQKYETLDGVYENLSLIKDSVRKKLEAGKDSAYMSKELARIYTDAPIKLNLGEMDGSGGNPAGIQKMFDRLEFKNLSRQLPEIMRLSDGEQTENRGELKLRLAKSQIISSLDALQKVKLESEQIFIVSRSASAHGERPELLILGDGTSVYVLELAKLGAGALVPILSNLLAGKKLVGHNLKLTLQTLAVLGMAERPVVGFDVQVAAFLINSLRRDLSLGTLAKEDLGYDGANLNELDADELTARSSEVIAILQKLLEKQKNELASTPKVAKLASKIEWPLVPVLAKMEMSGIELDTNYLKNFSIEIDDLVSDLEQQIYGLADAQFNIGSPAQLAEILFDKLKLPTAGIKKGKTGYSTAASELDKLRGGHPIIDEISKYREVSKLKNTYVDTLPRQVDGNSRLHTTFNTFGAQTGRLSSTDPNLQNIPVKTELGRKIREAFVAGPGKKLVNADYSQFELRLAAALSGETEMIEMFASDADVHTMTAAQVYGLAPEDVTKGMRHAAKAVNFGTMYGQGPHALAQLTGMSYGEAKGFIDKYFEIRPRLKEFIAKTRELAEKQGYVETIMGRRRPTPDVKSNNFAVREGAYRAAVNHPLQGSAADIMKLAMIRVDELLFKKFPDAKLLLQIHDSVLVECRAENAEAVAKLIKDTMESVYPELPVKLTAEVSIGSNWGEL